MLNWPDMLNKKWVRVLPHINDTLLLLTAVLLTLQISQYPLVDSWLTAKVTALFVYIGLGMVALRHGKTKSVRVTAFVSAVIVFAYIVGVAVTKNAWFLFV